MYLELQKLSSVKSEKKSKSFANLVVKLRLVFVFLSLYYNLDFKNLVQAFPKYSKLISGLLCTFIKNSSVKVKQRKKFMYSIKNSKKKGSQKREDVLGFSHFKINDCF